MTAIEIHVGISLNRNFATMSHLLLRSLAANAGLPGDWRVVFTVSRDTDADFGSPLFEWTRDYPVEFRWVDRGLFEAYGYFGTNLQRLLYASAADILLLLDADLLVRGSIAEVVEAAAADAVVACPAWGPPPDADPAALLASLGLPSTGFGLAWGAYGLAFMSPRCCPPYFNGGHVALSGSIARHMAQTVRQDADFVCRRYTSFFNPQLAFCLNIVRNSYPFLEMDPKFNMGNGEGLPSSPLDSSEAAAARHAHARRSISDCRVIHYCLKSTEFDKTRDIDGWDRVLAFCARKCGAHGNILLQQGLRAILGDIRR